MRVLVPCYKEGLDILRRTVMAAYDAHLPEVPRPMKRKAPGQEADRIAPSVNTVNVPVLIVRNTERFRTTSVSTVASMQQGCERTIYLLDDGKDIKKRKWVDTLGADVVYVSGRKREAGEMNGKSGNLNNVCSQLYPKGTPIPSTELLCIFDADQVHLSHLVLNLHFIMRVAQYHIC